MGFEGDRDRCTSDAFRFLYHLVKQALVADMDAVEIADGDHRAVEWFFNILSTFDDNHVSAAGSQYLLDMKVKPV
jgi:hypothetical protein